MLARIGPEPQAFRAEHPRDPLRPERALEFGVCIAGQTDTPESRLGDLLQRAGEIDYAGPEHALERARRGLGHDSAFGWRVAVLGDDPDCAECGGGAQDGADIVRIRNLVEHEQDRAFAYTLEKVVEPHFIERLGFDDHALVRRIIGDQSAEICDVGERNWEVRRELHEGRGLTRCPSAQYLTTRIVQRGRNRMPAPEARPVPGPVALMRFLAP